MHIISVMNYKGGVGKTTITANLAAELARRGRRVLLVDIDPQTNLTLSFITPEEWEKEYAKEKTIREWFRSFAKEGQLPLDLNEIIFSPTKINEKLQDLGSKGQVDIIASHLELINVDLDLAMELNAASLKQSARNFLKVHGRLAQGFQKIKDKKDYELILVDCPPNFNIMTKAAIVASDHLLIPTKADYLSTLGIDYLKTSLYELRDNYNEYANFDENISNKPINPYILGVIFNMIQVYGEQPINTIRSYMSRVKVKERKIPVFENYLRESKKAYAEPPEFGIPAVLYHPEKNNNVVDEIRNFVSEFERKLGLTTI